MSVVKIVAASKEEVTELARYINEAVARFHAARGIPSVDVRLVCEASAVVMTSYMVKTDAWTAYQLMNHSVGMLTHGIRTEAEQNQMDAERGSKSS